MIEDGDAQLLAIDLARVVHPIRGLAPDRLFMLGPFGVADDSGGAGDFRLALDLLVFLKRGRKTDAQDSVFGVAESDLGEGGGQGDIEIDNSQRRSLDDGDDA